MKVGRFGDLLFRRLLLLAGAYFLFGFCSLAVIGLLPGMARDLDESPEALAWLVATFSLAFAMGAVVGPMWSLRYPPRTVLVIGLLGLAIGAAALALATTSSQANVARWIQGLSSALIGPTALVFAIVLSPPELRGRALGMVFGGTMVAIVIGMPMTSWIGKWMPWRWIFATLAMVSLVIALSARLLLPKLSSGEGRRHGLEGILQTVVQPAVGLALLTTSLRMAAQFSCYTLIGSLAVNHFGLSAGSVAVVLFVYGVSGLAGNYASGHWLDRYGIAPVLRWCGIALVISYACLTLLSASSAEALVWVSIVCWGFTSVMFATPQQSFLARQPAPSNVSVALSLNAAASYAGMALGSGMASLIASRLDLGAVVWFSFFLSVLSIATSEMSLSLSRLTAGARE